MKLRSFDELKGVLPIPTSPAASALVTEARDLRATLDQMVEEAQAARANAAAQVATMTALEAEAQNLAAALQGIDANLIAFGVDSQAIDAIRQKAAEMQAAAQELRDDPAVRAIIALRQAEEAAQQKAAAETRQRLNAVLDRADKLARQGEYDKASGLIAQIRTEASSCGLAAAFGTPTAELVDIVARGRAAVKARSEAEAIKASKKAFGLWLKSVAKMADWAQGDVVVTLAQGHGMYLRPCLTRRGGIEWTVRGYRGPADEKPKGDVVSSISPRARVYDWRQDAPDAAKTLAEAERRARAYAIAQVQAQREAKADVPTKTVVAEDPTPVVVEAPVAPEPVAVAPAPVAAASDANGAIDGAILGALRELAQDEAEDELAPETIAVETAPADEGALVSAPADDPHLVVVEAEDPMVAAFWADAIATILTELGQEAIGATVRSDTPQVAAYGMVIDGDDGLEVAVTVNGRILSTPKTVESKSTVKAQSARDRNVTTSLRRQLARVLAAS
ncbi:MAG: hypothetical protein KKB13_08300 [Chloroflexi bacterium]|nr:hypothetical protein [Chloroflexota bacterium]